MRTSTFSLLAILDTILVGFAVVSPTQSFSVNVMTFVVSKPRLPLRLSAKRRAKGADDDDDFDVDQVRQRLEALLVETSDSLVAPRQESPKIVSMLRDKHLVLEEDPIDFDLDLSARPPLTSIERERRLAEIHLLSKLDTGDDGLSDLWTYWFQERGAAAAARLLRIEELIGHGPKSWGESERLLKELIQDYGIFWVEPVNRLATLYYMQGKLRESETLSKIVLKVKPWHFGALSGIVMVYAGLRDSESARMWAARRMPTFAPESFNRRRKEWVQRAVDDAEASLDEAEKRLVRSFGKPDERRVLSQELSADDMWQ